LQNQNSFEAIHQLLQEITSSSDSSEEWESDSAFSSESTEVENNESIPQTTEKSDLSACAVIDIIEGEIRSCGDTENLRVLQINCWLHLLTLSNINIS